jgi:hypothetical protein
MATERPSRNQAVETFGTSLIHHRLLSELERLWEGPVRPEALPDIEVALRAFFVGKSLAVLPVDSMNGDSDYADRFSLEDFSRPFHDHLLDYEFFDTNKNLPRQELPAVESTFLENLVRTLIITKFKTAMPKFVTMFEAYNFAAKWYGDSHAYGDYDDDLKKFNESEFYATCPLFHLGPSHDARLIVELTRQGYSLYGRIPLFEICYEHLFSRWPDAIFEELGQEYQAFQRSLRGPWHRVRTAASYGSTIIAGRLEIPNPSDPCGHAGGISPRSR